MGIWNRLFSGVSSPEAGWLTLAGDEPHFEGDVNGVRVWRFADGDAVGIYFFAVVPDLPQVESATEFTTRYAEKISAAGVKLVESALVDLTGLRAVMAIVKIPQAPSGMTYVGSLTIPFATCSYVVKVQCKERGVTGLREAFLLDKRLRDGVAPEAALQDIAVSGDAPEHDSQFPAHPLARARKHLASLATAVRVGERLRSIKAFGLPSYVDAG